MTRDSSTAFRAFATASLLVLTLTGGSATAQMSAEQESIEPPRVERGATGPELSGPLDDDQYIVGPGDVLSITIWGQSVTEATATITPEGALVLPGVASIDAACHRAKQKETY